MVNPLWADCSPTGSNFSICRAFRGEHDALFPLIGKRQSCWWEGDCSVSLHAQGDYFPVELACQGSALPIELACIQTALPIELACRGRALPIEPAYTRAMMLLTGKQGPQQCVPSADIVGVALPAVYTCWKDRTCPASTCHIKSQRVSTWLLLWTVLLLAALLLLLMLMGLFVP